MKAGRPAGYHRLFFLIAAPLVILMAYQVYASYRLDYKGAEVEVTNLALVLEARIEDVFQRADDSVAGLASEVEHQALHRPGKEGSGAWDVPRATGPTRSMHKGGQARLFDAEGRELHAPAPGLPMDISGFGYFGELKSNPAIGTVFSDVLTNPETGRQAMRLAKSIRAADGTFLGVAQADIDLDAIWMLVGRMDVGSRDIVAMRRLDNGASVFRRSGRSMTDGETMLNCPVRLAVLQGRPSGTLMTACKSGDRAHLVGFRALGKYPFVVYVGLDKAHFLAGWIRDAAAMAAATAMALLVIWLIFRRLAESEGQRQQAEARLRENEKRFHDIVVASGDWVWEVDAAGRYTYASGGIRDLLGYGPEEVLGKTPFDFMPPEEARRVGEAYAAIVARRAPFRDLENVNVHRDGSLRHIETSGMPILGEDGGLIGYRGLDKDVSVRVEAELALQNSQATLSALFQSTPAGIVVTRQSDGRLVDVNEAFLAMYGARRDEVIGKSTLDLNVWDNPELRSKLIGLVLGHGNVKDFEVVLHNKAGAARTGSISAALVDLAGEKHIVGVIVDISERKRLETELKVSKDRLISALTVELERRAIAAEVASHAKSQFLANMSHEFRTPLNAIMGFGQILQRRMSAAEESDMLGKMMAAARSMLAMLNDVLTLSRLENGNLAVTDIDFDIDGVIEAVAQATVQKAADKCLTFNMEIDVLPRRLRGNPDHLRAILANYLDNAVKFTESGTVTLRGRVIEEGAQDALLRFEVVDTGIGVPAGKQARIFEPFEQADNSRTRQHGGAGLGLAINQRLVRLLGGEVGVESTEGRGSIFWFTARFRKLPPVVPVGTTG